MKIWERLIDRRLREETTIEDEQFGFMQGRGTTDAIFAVRQLTEKHRENRKDCMVFIDLEKGYDRVPSQDLEWYGHALTRRTYGQESDGDGGDGEKERNIGADVVE